MSATVSKRKGSPGMSPQPTPGHHRKSLRRVLSSPSLAGSPPCRSPTEPTVLVDSDHELPISIHSDQSLAGDDAEAGSSEVDTPLLAVYDPGDHTSRCPICLWEVTGLRGICSGCNRRVRYNVNDVSSDDYDMQDGNAKDEDVSPPSASSACSMASRNPTIALRTILSVFEFNCTPALTFNETPEVIPPAVIALSKLLSKASNGCEAIPKSLKPLLESNPRLRMEDFPHFVWAPEAGEAPLGTEIKLWERVQLIVSLGEDLRNTNAEAAAYHSLVQLILEGTNQETNRYAISPSPPLPLSNNALITDNIQAPVCSRKWCTSRLRFDLIS